jgi:hypothetical protein
MEWKTYDHECKPDDIEGDLASIAFSHILKQLYIVSSTSL